MNHLRLHNGHSWGKQKFPWYIIPLYRKKPETKLLLLVVTTWWLGYMVVFGYVIDTAWYLKALFVVLGLLNLVGPLYLLAKGAYLQPGEHKKRHMRVSPESFIDQVKAELNGE